MTDWMKPEDWPASQASAEHISYGLMSLWEMINFWFVSAHDVLANLNTMAAVSHRNEKLSRENAWSPSIDEQARSDVKKLLGMVENSFSCLSCSHIERASGSLARAIEKDISWSDLSGYVRGLRNAIRVELGEHIFYRYPKEKGRKLLGFEKEWKLITVAFPVVAADAKAAVDCYALGHNTSSVFHSMRVAEHGLRAIAKERKITLPKNRPIEWESWQPIIREIGKAATQIGNAAPSAARDKALAFYNGAIADLNGFKDEYRKSVSHARAAYDEHQALRAIEQVRRFMDRISERIDHRHHCIRWVV